jgi:DNA-binding CsgD family transcriptional regulator
LQEPPAADEQPAVSRELGLALLRANDPEGIGVLRTVRSSTTDPIARAEIATEIANSLGLRGRCHEAAKLLEESLAELPDGGGELADFLRGWLLLQMFWGLEHLPAGALAQPDEDPDTETTAGRLLLGQSAALLASGLGSVQTAAEMASRALADRAAAVGDTLVGLPPQEAMLALMLAGRGEEIADLFDPILDASRRRGALPAGSGLMGMRGFGQLLDGDLREAQADVDLAVEMVNRIRIPTPLAIWTGVALRIAAARGDIAGGEALLASTSADELSTAGAARAAFLCGRGELRRVDGRHAEARHDFLAASERIEWLPCANPELFAWRTGLAFCEASLGNGGRARELAVEAVDAARQVGGSRGVGIALGAQGTVTGGEEGLELLRESVGILATTSAAFERARVLVELGAGLRRANRRRDAREPLRAGLEIARRCGAASLEERARTELAASGARPRRAVFTGVESLTPSELRVARMANEGMTNREIAQELTVTEKTVETHMRHIFQKLDIGRRTELPDLLGGSPDHRLE